MTNQIIPFSFEKNSVRVINKNNEVWFVAADVCNVLDIKNPRSSVALLDDDEKGVHSIDTLGGKQELTIINESGLYALIMRSRKPEAKKFRKWVTSEVLPAIRKTGAYTRRKYHYPLESARPQHWKMGSINFTPKVLASKTTPTPELDLINELEADGYDVQGAKAKILSLHYAINLLVERTKDLRMIERQAENILETAGYINKEYGKLVGFNINPNNVLDQHLFSDFLPK